MFGVPSIHLHKDPSLKDPSLKTPSQQDPVIKGPLPQKDPSQKDPPQKDPSKPVISSMTYKFRHHTVNINLIVSFLKWRK